MHPRPRGLSEFLLDQHQGRAVDIADNEGVSCGIRNQTLPRAKCLLLGDASRASMAGEVYPTSQLPSANGALPGAEPGFPPSPSLLFSVSGRCHAERGGLRIYEAVSSPRRCSCIHSVCVGGARETVARRKRCFQRERDFSWWGCPKGSSLLAILPDADRISFFCPLCDLRDDPVDATGSGMLMRAQLWPAG